MKSSWMKCSVLPAAFLLVGGVAMAQEQSSSGSQSSSGAQGASSQGGSSATPTPAPAEKPKPTVAQRKENQQDRIANGVKSGQLTTGETANLEKKEAVINKETAADRAAHDGKLTAAEKKQVNRQQNQMSKQIYNDKHNANTAHYGDNKVGQRRENQQDRIAEGIKSGQMTAGEAARAEKQQQGIHKQVAADRKANGGKLNAREKKQINKEQNAASRNIYRHKHNARTQAGAGKP
jgi:hypothetical protein